MAAGLLYLGSKMSKPKPIQISIPQPCHEDWDKMTPTEQGKFCNNCQKCVVDFTSFTDRQLFNYLNTHKHQKICGRFENAQLQRTIYTPKNINTYNSIFQKIGFTLLLTHGYSLAAFSKTTETYQQSINEYQYDESYQHRHITGRILNPQKEPLIGGIIQVYKNDSLIAQTNTDEEGNYTIINLQPDLYNVKVSYTELCSTLFINVQVKPDRNTIVNANLLEKTTPPNLLIIDYKSIPEIAQRRTFTKEEIEGMPTRSTGTVHIENQNTYQSNIFERTWKKVKSWFN